MKQLYVRKSKINGDGLHTAELIQANETVDYVHGPLKVVKKFSTVLAKQSLDWIGAGRYTWIDTKKSKFKYINHSCNPNVAIVTKRKVIAIRDIQPNEELLMDYSFTEADKDWVLPGRCHCGARNCRKTIGPIFTLSKVEFNKNRANIPKNFQRVYEIDCLS